MTHRRYVLVNLAIWFFLALAALAGLTLVAALLPGCSPAVERHTWGELGFYIWSDEAKAWVPLDEPIPPEVWEELQNHKSEVAPEEPTRTMPTERRDRWLVCQMSDVVYTR